MSTRPKRLPAVLVVLLAFGHLACSEESILRVNALMFSTKAQARLGLMYRTGNGVEKDPAEAARWYGKAAHRGNAAAQMALGSLYEAGEGVQRDLAEAVRLYQLAADQDHRAAHYALGLCYEKGVGVEPDLVSAHVWFHLAALMGIDVAFQDLKRVQAAMNPEQVAEAQRRALDIYGRPQQAAGEPS